MDIGSIFLILALLILVMLFIARPLFERKAVAVDAVARQEDHEVSALLAERDRILNALEELDFDHALGKIPEEDYPAQRARLMQRGAEVLRQLDEHSQRAPSDNVEARIEAAIAARRADAVGGDGAGLEMVAQDAAQDAAQSASQIAGVAVLEADDEVEARLAARRRARQDKSAGFCPQCGQPVQRSDRFCPKCGRALT